MRFARRLAATALALSVLAGPSGGRRAARAQTLGAAPEPAPNSPADKQRRRQAAIDLRRQGFDIDWRLASWPELHDWTLRADEARLLRDRYGVIVDWRAYALAEMKDWEGRISRAAELRRFSIEADWRLYTARQLDELRIYLERARSQPPTTPRPAQELVPPEVTLGFDPDAILVPTYVTEELSRDDADDAILEPNFSRARRRAPPREDAPSGTTSAPTPAPPAVKPAPPATPATPAPRAR
jgi:hypothetical protein